MREQPGHHHVEVRNAYADSVMLLQVSRRVGALQGVLAAQVAMATPLNLEVLVGMGFTIPPCSPNDMVVALRLDDPDRLPDALDAVAAALAPVVDDASQGGGATESPPRTTGSALRRSGADVALVSVPGAFAAVEAMDALDAERDVMVFSDNVPVPHEVALKRTAAERGLLVMGPDCGTALVGGVGLGFVNVVEPGPIGIVAASGTGCQQLMCLLAAAGVGVGAALGVGGRDLSADVGGLSTREALRRLDSDPSIHRIVLVSKPPAPEVAAELEAYAAGLSTPVDLALLGPGRPDLTAVVGTVLTALGITPPPWPTWGATAAPPGSGHLRGLFVGGTLCDEAMLVAAATLGPVHSNIPLAGGHRLTDPGDAVGLEGPVMIDFGDDRLTQGRAHPMIDPTLRLQQIAAVAADPTSGVLLLDVVLGHAAEADPAALLAPAIASAITAAGDRGRTLPVVVSCTGTEADPQGLTRQARALAEAGAEVHLSNAGAARRAVDLVVGGAR